VVVIGGLDGCSRRAQKQEDPISSPSYSSGSGGTATIPAEITGRSLAQRLRGWSAPQRAVLVRNFVLGKTTFVEPTTTLLAQMCKVSVAYADHALNLSDADCDAVWKGLRPLVPAKAVQLDLPLSAPATTKPTEMSDAAFLSKIKSIGIERALEAVAAVEAGE
jgi:hypothetical protein